MVTTFPALDGLPPLGVTLGRLSPPVGDRLQAFPEETWEIEFEAAAACGFAFIEWIVERYQAERNPLRSAAGVGRLLELGDRFGVRAQSVCIDLLLEEPFWGSTGGDEAMVEQTRWMIRQAGMARMRWVVLPFFKASRLDAPPTRTAVVRGVQSCLDEAERSGVELHLECGLDPTAFRDLLDRLDHPLVRATYDTGNSALFGYDPREELPLLGPRIGSVHLKDHVRGGPSVPLGTGDTDFAAVFRLLVDLGYRGPFVLQGARDPARGESELARAYQSFYAAGWRAATTRAGAPSGRAEA